MFCSNEPRFTLHHEDEDHNHITVLGNDVTVTFTARDWRYDNSTAVWLHREAVANLRDALTAWLGDAIQTIAAPPTPDTELIERLVSQAVTEEVARVLPLHFSPLAQAADGPEHDAHPVRCRVCGAEWHDAHGQPGSPCRRPGAPAPKCTCVHPTNEHHAPSPHRMGGCTYCLCAWPGVES